jgi:hypothetical protein
MGVSVWIWCVAQVEETHMTDLLENVGLLVLLMLAGVSTTVTVLIMFIKALDYLESQDD